MIRVDAKALLKLLHKMEEVEQATAQNIYNDHKKGGMDIIAACMKHGISESVVMYACAQMLGLEPVQLSGLVLPQGLIDKVPSDVANTYRIIPVRMEDKTLVVATADPDNLAALDDLKFMLGVAQVRPALTSEASITEALEQYYSQEREKNAQTVKDLMDNIGDEEVSNTGPGGQETFSIDANALAGIDSNDQAALAESAPVRKLLNLILLTAVKALASDVHFEPF